jgi:hypothetical protein
VKTNLEDMLEECEKQRVYCKEVISHAWLFLCLCCSCYFCHTRSIACNIHLSLFHCAMHAFQFHPRLYLLVYTTGKRMHREASKREKAQRIHINEAQNEVLQGIYQPLPFPALSSLLVHSTLYLHPWSA